MKEDLRKRLEEAAREYVINNDSLTCAYNIARAKDDFLAGAKLGYKEAIKVAKEWMEEYFPEELDGKNFEFVSRDDIIADFETDMNKQMEEKK